MILDLKTVLEQRGITQKELATLTGMTEASISRKIRNPKLWRAKDIAKIMDALHLTPDEVVLIFLR